MKENPSKNDWLNQFFIKYKELTVAIFGIIATIATIATFASLYYKSKYDDLEISLIKEYEYKLKIKSDSLNTINHNLSNLKLDKLNVENSLNEKISELNQQLINTNNEHLQFINQNDKQKVVQMQHHINSLLQTKEALEGRIKFLENTNKENDDIINELKTNLKIINSLIRNINAKIEAVNNKEKIVDFDRVFMILNTSSQIAEGIDQPKNFDNYNWKMHFLSSDTSYHNLSYSLKIKKLANQETISLSTRNINWIPVQYMEDVIFQDDSVAIIPLNKNILNSYEFSSNNFIISSFELVIGDNSIEFLGFPPVATDVFFNLDFYNKLRKLGQLDKRQFSWSEAILIGFISLEFNNRKVRYF